jgi:hypothetical protein
MIELFIKTLVKRLYKKIVEFFKEKKAWRELMFDSMREGFLTVFTVYLSVMTMRSLGV